MQTKRKITLADVDGTEPGRVQLMSIKLVDGLTEDPQQMSEYYEEEPGNPDDPWLRAEGFKRSIEDDWPNRYWAIVGNPRAHYLKWRRAMREMGFLGEESWSPEAYLELEGKDNSTHGNKRRVRHEYIHTLAESMRAESEE